MAFRYRLETLLRLQRSVEHQEENRLLVCVARIASLNAALRSWEEEWSQRRASLWAELKQGAAATLVQFTAMWEQAVTAKEKEIRRQLAAAEQARQEQLKVYRAARQKREMLESLKEHGESAYMAEELRRAQRALDEAHLTRSFYRDNG
jgi:flagellar export protein FliJ